ncbi:hypothetical protein [Saccharothrix saharensis]|nr:hypothetical protein [Saccharothrix saharensis]
MAPAAVGLAAVAEATPPGLRGRAMSLRLTGNRLGQVLVPGAAGRRPPD